MSTILKWLIASILLIMGGTNTTYGITHPHELTKLDTLGGMVIGILAILLSVIIAIIALHQNYKPPNKISKAMLTALILTAVLIPSVFLTTIIITYCIPTWISLTITCSPMILGIISLIPGIGWYIDEIHRKTRIE